MPDAPIRILLVEDDEDDYVVTRDLLREIGSARFQLDWAADYDAGLTALCERRHDVGLVDYRLGAHDGIEFLTAAHAQGCTLPLILLTGQGDHAVDLAAMQAGAADFLTKSQLTPQLLERAIRYSIQQRRAELQRIELSKEHARRQQAETANRAKDEFLAMLAHELRNPLAAIDGAIQLLRHPASGADRETALGVADRQVRHLVRLIDDLLDVSRITQGKIQLSREPLRVADVLRRAAQATRPQIERGRHEFQLDAGPDDLWVHADPTRLEQIVVNLLTNAAKYTDPGGRITLSAAREQDQAVLRCRDTGAGLTPEMLARVFELFAQNRETLDRSQGGLGIGLTLVRMLARLHGGDVTAQSDGPGRGSEFVVRLPAVAPAATAPKGTAPAATAAAAVDRRILVVDDNADAARMLAALLRARGHHVETAGSGAAALETASVFRPDVVLLDIGLPGMDGYEVARRLREQPEARTAFLVALTGYGRPEDRRRSTEAGFDAHLVKPVDLASLQRLLAERPAR